MERIHPYRLCLDESRFIEASVERKEYADVNNFLSIRTELDVLNELIETGNSSQEIADVLGVSERTVRGVFFQLGKKFCEGGHANKVKMIRALAKEGIIVRVNNEMYENSCSVKDRESLEFSGHV